MSDIKIIIIIIVIVILLLLLLLLFVTFVQCIYNYIPETHSVSRVYSVAGVL